MNSKFFDSGKRSAGLLARCFVAALLIGLTLARPAFAGTQVPPIVMEEATVQGKIIILENFKEDRQAAAGLLIEIWSAKEFKLERTSRRGAKQAAKAVDTGYNFERHELILETETDEDGFFYIEEGSELPAGNYIMVIGEVDLILIVEPLSSTREKMDATEKQKTLLILVPKEIFLS